LVQGKQKVMRSLTTNIEIVANKKDRLNLKELWLYRELLYYLSLRDIKVRYKQTILGAGWAILQPLLAAAIFTLFFNRVAHISSGAENVPYPVFAFLGITLWNAFSGSLTGVSNALVTSQALITKVYFPRFIPLLSATALSIVDLFFASLAFVILLVLYGIMPQLPGILIAAPSIILILTASLGVGALFASLNVKYRDVRTALPFLIQILFFMTPVIYPITLIPLKYQIFAYLNPATGAITSIKSGLFGQPINWKGYALSWIVAIISLIIGVWYFQRTEKNFVDVI
jgi:lipopolysaccharide transport system permease protein